MSRSPVDNWGKREQLCLASAVSCSGEQNWIAVSRAMKTLCKQESRPADWYSQKNCALQYAYLLESVDVVKRKKRDDESPVAVEPPTQLLLKRLTEEHMQDIKEQMERDREEYAQLFHDINVLESGEMNHEELLEMWRQMDKEDETKRIEEMKLENRMREREQRKQEMISNWRSSPDKRTNSNSDTTAVDMDVEEILTDAKSALPQQQQPATSPLLSSLLKTPNAGGGSTSNMNSSTSATSNSMARTSSPTITTLLTSGNIPKNPAITIKSNIPASEIAFITRPISGPPLQTDALSPTITNTGKSPSQSAPTLSMLLEKNKIASGSGTVNTQNITQQPTEINQQVSSNSSETDASNNCEIPLPMEIEEKSNSEAAAATKKSTATSSGGAEANDDNDPNEEQQLLEVFKNIGNMDDIEIDMAGVIDDEEVDFLEDVDASSPNDDVKEVIDFEDKLDELKRNQESLASGSSEKLTTPKIVEIKKKDDVENPNGNEKSEVKTEIIVGSSDESNDNIPLAEVASLESKERSQSATDSTKDEEATEAKGAKGEALKKEEGINVDTQKMEELIKINKNDEKESSPATSSPTVDKEQNSAAANLLQDTEMDNKNFKSKLPTESDSSDVILIQTDDDESVFEKPSTSSTKAENVETDSSPKEVDIKQSEDHETQVKTKSKTKAEIEKESSDNCVNIEMKPVEAEKVDEDLPADSTTNAEESNHPTIITIPDTDEDSSMTDVSKEEAGSIKSTTTATNSQRNNKSIGVVVEDCVKTETDNTVTKTTNTSTNSNPSVTVTVAAMTPARPPMLRKLADRSESPMIEDETSTTTTSDHSTKPNSRRRYSSTPVIDSIPNSPASSEYTENDRRETRAASKKIFLSIYNNLHDSKNALIFRRAFQDEHSKLADLCSRPMDLPTIKRNIDSGIIRNVVDLQHDMLLMCQNVLMIYRPQSAQHKTALAFLQDCQGIKEFSTVYHENKLLNNSLNTSSSKSRSGSRKSQRHI